MLDVQMHVQPMLVATALGKLCEGSLTLAFDSDEDYSSGLYGAATAHQCSTDLGDAAEHTGTVLGVETGVAPKTSDVLGTVHAGRAVTRFLDDEDLFLFQVVE